MKWLLVLFSFQWLSELSFLCGFASDISLPLAWCCWLVLRTSVRIESSAGHLVRICSGKHHSASSKTVWSEYHGAVVQRIVVTLIKLYR
jgi:hypothetical protein